jgi:asparagine synthase (glutamine-hydrolysing)
MGRLFLLRTLPWDPVMVDNDLLAFYQSIPPQLKLNARLFRQAVLRVLPETARAVPNNNDGMSLASPEWARDARYIAAMSARKLARFLGFDDSRKLATAGSWPNFRYFIATSRVLPELWSNPGAGTRELLSELLGRDPWERTLPEWAASGSDLILRLITLKLWLESRRT